MKCNPWVGRGVTGMGGIPMLGTGARGLTTLIKGIFRNNEQGFAYDPNDLTTLYQDAAGTIPVTAAGQPVGLMKDKSGRNNHAFQTVSASRPILRQTPILGNELVVNGDFSNGLINVAPRNGGTLEIVSGALKVTNTGTYYGYAEMALPTEVGKLYLLRGDVVASSGAGAAFHITSLPNSSDIATNVEGAAAAAGVMFTAKTTTTYLSLKTPSNAIGAWRIFDNISIKEITGYRTDQNYLAFDGVDDFLVTNHINFTVTDKISLFAGVRKLSDSGTGMVYELSPDLNTNNGGFYLTAPSATNGNNYSFSSKGTVSIYATITGYRSPATNVLTAKSAISTDSLTVRIDGAEKMLSGADQGVGNYGYHQLFIGRRGGTYAPFRGNIYSLIGIGRLTSNSETIALEKSIAKNTGVVLSV